jgi:hypothetical protein
MLSWDHQLGRVGPDGLLNKAAARFEVENAPTYRHASRRTLAWRFKALQQQGTPWQALRLVCSSHSARAAANRYRSECGTTPDQRRWGASEEELTMAKRKSTAEAGVQRPGKQHPGAKAKTVDWAEHVFEERMLYVRVRFTDQTDLCWVLQTAHVILKVGLGDCKKGGFGRPAVFVQNESDLP